MCAKKKLSEQAKKVHFKGLYDPNNWLTKPHKIWFQMLYSGNVKLELFIELGYCPQYLKQSLATYADEK